MGFLLCDQATKRHKRTTNHNESFVFLLCLFGAPFNQTRQLGCGGFLSQLNDELLDLVRVTRIRFSLQE